ncbi:hypothetical protein Droror1_Dr00010463 [Drosera rotundifolia]
MARSTGYSYLMILMAVIYMVATSVELVNGQCRGDLTTLARQCARFVQKPGSQVPPSKACCAVVKTVDVGCMCSNLPPEAAKFISMQKVGYVCRYCGSPLPPGAKCLEAVAP